MRDVPGGKVGWQRQWADPGGRDPGGDALADGAGGTIATYVEALGGRLEIIADFGD